MDEILTAHIIMGVATFLPAVLMKVIDPRGTSDRVGYRTNRSLKTPETKEFANRYAANGMLWAATSTVTIQLTLYFLVGGETAILITAGFMTLSFLSVVAFTERELKLRFDKDGKPKKLMPKY